MDSTNGSGQEFGLKAIEADRIVCEMGKTDYRELVRTMYCIPYEKKENGQRDNYIELMIECSTGRMDPQFG